MTYILLIVEFIILAYAARWVTETLFLFFVRISGSRNVALSLTTLLLFPGTVVHELSHLFLAEILGVRTGKLTLTPEAIEDPSFAEASAGKEVRSGSVTITQTGPIRRTIIGLSPVLVGVTAVVCISYLVFLPPDALSSLLRLPLNQNQIVIFRIVLFYLLFAIGNTMFSSKEDLKGVLPVFLTIGLFVSIGYFIGIRIGVTGQTLTIFQQIASALLKSLGIVLAVNGVILLALKLLLVLIGKMRRN